MDLLEDGDVPTTKGSIRLLAMIFVLSIEELLPLLTNQTTVFMGQTGVENRPCSINRPDLELETGEISDEPGAQSTHDPSCQLYHLNGGKIAGTPGFSSLDYEK